MSVDPSARIIALPDLPAPAVEETAFVAAGAVLVGDVRLGDRASVWYNAVLRAEAEPITIGERSNLQDTVACHVDRGFPLVLGAGVSVGHGAVLHGCTVEDDCLIGMNATVLNGAVIGAGSLVAAGAVVLEGTVVPPGSLVAGVPAKVRRELTDDERAGIRRNAESYLGHVERHSSLG
ncbi:gamma carbonic anhydrase family protein [Agromyces sp. NPDC058110]|uniref:gamma carbonic anhydrase family protein n=1 Tax=Agromyces sp. NPDC058110 TaxID=3346345 RepID=UPI0036DA33B2